MTKTVYEGYGVSFLNLQTTSNDVTERVRSIIADQLGVDKSIVIDNASFINDLGADSLDLVELILEFERVFNISIPDDEALSIQTVGQAILHIFQMRNLKL